MASERLVSIAWLLTSILSSQMRTKTCALKGSGKMLGLHSTWGLAHNGMATGKAQLGVATNVGFCPKMYPWASAETSTLKF